MHWKVERDKFYRELTPDEREEAGFFYDTSITNNDWQNSLGENSTPVHWISRKLNYYNMRDCSVKCAVLCLTGAFAPIHRGHIKMLEVAKKRLHKAGYDEVFAFIAPDHDEYVQMKTNGFSIDERVHEIRKAIKEYNWIDIDYWPAYFNDHAINFTDVVSHLSEYLTMNLYEEVDVFYVAGGDNARFALAFKNQGNCVIVNRPSYEDRVNKYSYLVDNKRIFMAECNEDISSTEIRKEYKTDFHNPIDLILRIDLENSSRDWQVYEALASFYNKIELVCVQEQQRLFNKIQGKTISLDPLIRGTYNIGISRNFDYMGTRMLGYSDRPGYNHIVQIQNIPAGEYTLYDDDICTGGTMADAKKCIQLFNKGVKIKEETSFVRSTKGVEVLDARDFYEGENNGLVVANKRKPYILPYVLPSARASVKNSFKFSDALKGI